jgi:hypothetical protein
MRPGEVQRTRCTPKKQCFPKDFLAKFFFSNKQSFKSSFYFFSNFKMMSWRVCSDREIKKFSLKSPWWRCIDAELPSSELDEYPKLCKILASLKIAIKYFTIVPQIEAMLLSVIGKEIILSK